MDLLNEANDMIRNEALLLLVGLTQGNQDVQKIVAFEGAGSDSAFDKLLDIIDDVDEDEIIVHQDCLKLLKNLLVSNQSNQTFFCEATSAAQRLALIIELPSPATDARQLCAMLCVDIVEALTGHNYIGHNYNAVCRHRRGCDRWRRYDYCQMQHAAANPEHRQLC